MEKVFGIIFLKGDINMKRSAIIIASSAALALLATGCSSRELGQGGSDSVSSVVRESGSVEALGTVEESSSVAFKASVQDLDRSKHGYGQGVQLDELNRPIGATDFNNRYGKYNATAISDNTEEKVIYLTFDQGYENGYTSKILDTLKEKNVKAIFFVLQDYAEKNPELVERMIAEGHVVGNHSKSHFSMPELTAEQCQEEISSVHDYILENFDYKMELFRPPMGEFSEFSLAQTQLAGYRTVLWSYAYADWDVNAQPDYETAYTKLVKAAHPGAIYLLHSVSKTNAEVLPAFIDKLISEGYTFRTDC